MNNILNKEELAFCETHMNIIQQIIITNSCSFITPAYLEGLKEINKKYHYTNCVTCNSSIFMATSMLHKDWLHTNNTKIEQKIKGNGSKKESKNRNNKRSTE